MSRIHRFLPDDLDPAQRVLYAELTTGGRPGAEVADPDGRLTGPFNAMLLNPLLGDAVQRLGAAIRYHGALSGRSREIAILTVAARLGSGFEQRTHEPIAASVGVTDEELRAIRQLAEPALADPEEAAVLRATRLLLGTDQVSDADYRELAGVLGEARLFELSTLVGYYSLLARQMDLFGVS